MQQHNQLFIMFDQMRHDWFGAAGASHVPTPNIDRLAARSRVFTQAVTNSPVCAPARIGLATGIRPHRMGALNNHAFMPLRLKSYYAQLRDHGYHVGCCGKLDLAKPWGYNGLDGARPWTYSWGFTHPHEVEGKMHAGRCNPPAGPYSQYLHEKGTLEDFCEDYSKRKSAGRAWGLDPSVLKPEDFADTYIGRKACEMIRNMPPDYPWHMFVSFVGPHNPFDPPQEYFEMFENAEMPDAIPFEPEGKPRRYTKGNRGMSAEEVLKARRLYTASRVSGYKLNSVSWL